MKKVMQWILVLILLVVQLPIEAASAGKAKPERIVVTGSHYVAKGLKIQLKASVFPENANQDIVWKSSKPEIARVSKSGKVTGMAAGSATITAASKADGEVKKKWKITVTEKKVRKVKITATSKVIDLNGAAKQTLNAEAKPGEAAQAFTWKSSNRKIAVVSEKGVVTGKKPGKVTITAKAVDGSGTEGTYTITVKQVVPQEIVATAETKYYALLIGNGKYSSRSSFNPLKSPPNDVKAMKAMLGALSQDWQVTVKQNLTGSGIVSAIKGAFKNAGAEDVCLFYYAGHGQNDDAYIPGALLGIHFNTGNDSRNGRDYVSAALLTRTLAQACPGKVIVILDSCGSGAMTYNGEPLQWAQKNQGSPKAFTDSVISAFRTFEGRTEKTGEMRKPRFTVLAACEYGDESVQLPLTDKMDASIFGYCILKAMGCRYPSGAYTGSTPADGNGDGQITLREVFSGANAQFEMLKTKFSDLLQTFVYYGNADSVLFIR